MRHYIWLRQIKTITLYIYLIDVFASYEHYDPKYNLYDEPHIVDVSIDQSEAFILSFDQLEALTLFFYQSETFFLSFDQ